MQDTKHAAQGLGFSLRRGTIRQIPSRDQLDGYTPRIYEYRHDSVYGIGFRSVYAASADADRPSVQFGPPPVNTGRGQTYRHVYSPQAWKRSIYLDAHGGVDLPRSIFRSEEH